MKHFPKMTFFLIKWTMLAFSVLFFFKELCLLKKRKQQSTRGAHISSAPEKSPFISTQFHLFPVQCINSTAWLATMRLVAFLELLG